MATDDDHARLRNVHGDVRRRLAWEPATEDVETSRCRCSPVNWGHAPLKKR